MPRSFVRVDDPVDALFALPPSEFTAARNALVKQLRAAKRRDEAEAVKALKRPSVPAWAINQVARAQPEAIEQLISAGAAVGAAQRRALSGVRDSGLREASAQRRERIDQLWRLAADLLRDAGTEPFGHRQAIAATLEAASVDPAAAELVRKGRLSADLPAPSGFGDVAGFSLVPDEGPEGEQQDATQDDAAEHPTVEPDDTAARQALAEAEREAARARHRADELQDRASQARRTAVRSADEAERLERRAAQTRGRAEEETAAADELAATAQAASAEADEAEAREQQARAALASATRPS